ncbi:uncharacterized protein aunip [Siphateles boraxobius]|uniref:uncharacterized protein aunip n=1 Tax=Siphateles boraxobius TaxID=180520 RepID=UPI0040628E7D
MKSSKSTKAKPAKEEECGIWLDTKELKEKKQQLKGPISRLTVSFTQTKLNMPVTRQSIISSFFTHTHSDPNRSATHTGNKRKHGMTSDSTRPTSELDPQNRDGSSHKDQKEQRFFHLIRGEESEDEEPPEKRRHVAHYIQEYDQNVLKTHQNKEENPNKMVPHGGQKATVKGRVLTPRPVNQNHSSGECETKASAMSRLGKENNWPESSPKRRRVSSPAKCRLKEKHTLVSPEKCVSAGESLASLFTQDSEGLCVIAHRDRHSLTERRNSSEDNSHGYSVCVLVEEEEEEMLFTQDSEGNMVIKH